MSEARRIDRRTLFDVFRRRTPPSETSEGPNETEGVARFSLGELYARRARSGDPSSTIPRFALREGLPVVETVPVFAEPTDPVTRRRS